jgi:Ca2+-binding RTX toxin-like protein
VKVGGVVEDRIVNIESIYGGSANDTLWGDGAANSLRGLAGGDRLAGFGANDTLTGGAGVDALTGGLGKDTFQYLAASEGGDAITDFTAVDDGFLFLRSAFGGLPAGVLAASRFQSRVDNVAQDADDRFIFRTADKTLWFDANGSAAGGLTLIADLQPSATVTNADIMLA